VDEEAHQEVEEVVEEGEEENTEETRTTHQDTQNDPATTNLSEHERMAVEEQQARDNPDEPRTVGAHGVIASTPAAANRADAARTLQNVLQDDSPLEEFFGGTPGVNRGAEYSGVSRTDRPQYAMAGAERRSKYPPENNSKNYPVDVDPEV